MYYAEVLRNLEYKNNQNQEGSGQTLNHTKRLNQIKKIGGVKIAEHTCSCLYRNTPPPLPAVAPRVLCLTSIILASENLDKCHRKCYYGIYTTQTLTVIGRQVLLMY